MKRPADFMVRYQWVAASIPPPYHYEYNVSIGPGLSGLLAYTPDYPGSEVPTWTAPFPVTEHSLEELYQLCLRQRILTRHWREVQSTVVGDDTSRLHLLTNGDNIFVHSRMVNAALLEPVYALMTQLVPAEIWGLMAAQRERYMQAHPE